MNTDNYLTAVTTRDLTLYAGKYAKAVPAGTHVLVSADAIESEREAVYIYVANRTRVSGVVYRSTIEPA